MICPKCKELDQKSRVTPHGGFSTAMYCAPYYGEDDKYHFHDLNRHRYTYSCSSKHVFTVTKGNKCSSCDFGTEDKVEVIEQ